MFFNVEGGQLVLAKEELRGLPAFSPILARDKGSDGDVDGRKKYRAFKEFYYIWYVCDVRSPGIRAGFGDKELHLRGVKEARLEDNYKPDKLIKDAIAYYKTEQVELLVTANAVNNLIKGIRLSDTISRRLISSMEELLSLEETEAEERAAIIERGETPPPLNLLDMAAKTSALINHYDQLVAMAQKTPKILDTLNDLEKKLKLEESGGSLTRGGHKKGNRADPNR